MLNSFWEKKQLQIISVHKNLSGKIFKDTFLSLFRQVILKNIHGNAQHCNLQLLSDWQQSNINTRHYVAYDQSEYYSSILPVFHNAGLCAVIPHEPIQHILDPVLPDDGSAVWPAAQMTLLAQKVLDADPENIMRKWNLYNETSRTTANTAKLSIIDVLTVYESCDLILLLKMKGLKRYKHLIDVIFRPYTV